MDLDRFGFTQVKQTVSENYIVFMCIYMERHFNIYNVQIQRDL
jgi:hypothetical protein